MGQHREVVVNALTGEETEVWSDLPDVLSEADALAREAEAERVAFNDAIKAQLAANDLRAVRALLDGDAARLGAIKAEQVALRGQFR